MPTVKNRLTAATCTSISDCQTQITQSENAVADLKKTALSYQDAINHLNSQIGQLQGEIDTNIAKQNDLKNQIAAKQKQIDQQRELLGDIVKTMYIDGQMSTIEMLATSKDLSDYVDKEEYRIVVQNKIQDMLKQITLLQQQLQAQKTEVDSLLAQQQAQQANLASARAEQSNMLAYNQSQQDSYNSQTATNRAKLDQLIEEQRRANNVYSTSGLYFIRFPGAVSPINDYAYPYANAGFGMSLGPGCVDNDGPDPWGYCTRQCVSYAAWAVLASGRAAPMYYGNAKDWVAHAQADYYKGVRVYTSNPMPGDVLISTSGTWGHAMYVEGVSGNQVHISEYNQQLNGTLRNDRWITYQ